jgi:Cof subfamily protein (haloacid dehalogenase superfamily)
MAALRYQILALDVDGTLLDAGGTLRPRTLAAIERASDAGIRPVLCTGRRYRRARPVAQQLSLSAPLVCNSGSVIKDPTNHLTLWRADFDAALAADVLELFRAQDQPVVVFTDRGLTEADFIIEAYPTGQAYFDDYVDQNHEHAEINSGWGRYMAPAGDEPRPCPNENPLFHVCALGSRAQMLAFEQAAHCRFAGRVQTFVQRSPRYLGTMCELLRPDAGKWNAVLHLARLWGVEPSAICAVGDDVNDIPMIKCAGLGVAMGHARPEVLSAADLVTGDHDHDGVATLVDEVLLCATIE